MLLLLLLLLLLIIIWPQAQTIAAQVGWLGLKVGSRRALLYIHQMNWVNSRNDFVMVTAP